MSLCESCKVEAEKQYPKATYKKILRKPHAIFRLHALNDKNGNPRRVYVVMDEQSNIEAAIEEGHMGKGAIEAAGYEIPPYVVSFRTIPSEILGLLGERGRWKVFIA